MGLALRGIRRPPVLDGVDLDVGDGEVVGLLGANGSGKTTLLHVAADLRRAEGTVQATGPVGWMGEPGDVPRTTAQVLALVAHGRGAAADAVQAVRDRLPLVDGPVEALSAGQRRLVLLACAVVGDPAVLLLDEPLTHLDDAGVGLVVAEVERARDRGAAVAIATHRPDALPLDRRVHLAGGKLT